MKNLSNLELIEINGGSCPGCEVSTNPYVQTGYTIGYHTGKVIGQTISDFGAVLKALNPFSWFK